jgi:hypothetical protein
MKNKEIIEKLKNEKTKFTVKDVVDYKKDPVIFETQVHYPGESIEFHSINVSKTLDGMNVEEFGPYSMKLYSYSIFKKKIKETIKYSEIEFIED